jgi:hypothetical protein
LKAIPVESSLRISPSSPSSQFGTKAWLLLEFSFSLDEDFAELLLEFSFSLDEDFALLLDTLVSRSLDFGVTLEDDSSSQSSQMDEEESSSRGAKLLSSSPQAARNARNRSTGNRSAWGFI